MKNVYYLFLQFDKKKEHTIARKIHHGQILQFESIVYYARQV